MNLIEKIANFFKPKPSELTQKEIDQKLKEIANASEEIKKKKAVESNWNEKLSYQIKPIVKNEPSKQKQAESWNLELIMSLEWKRFEEVCKEYLVMKGHNAKLTCNGSDGGIDIKITDQAGNIKSIGQCKAWKKQVAVKEIREFLGTMTGEKVSKGVFFTTSSFSQEAVTFSLDKNITLIDGYGLIKRIKELSADNQEQLLSFAIAGDYTTPTCVNCNTKMIRKTAKESGNEFWGCRNFPRCTNKLNMRKA